MPSIVGGMARLDVNDPDDLAVLIDRGLIWRGGPQAMQRALRAITSGEVPRPTRNVPPEVDAYLDKLGIPPAGELGPEGMVPAEPEDGLDPEEGDDLAPPA